MGPLEVIILLWLFGFFGCCDGCKCSNHEYNEYDYIPYTSNYKDCRWCKREFDTTDSKSEKDPHDAKKVYCSKECLSKEKHRRKIISKIVWGVLIIFWVLVTIQHNMTK